MLKLETRQSYLFKGLIQSCDPVPFLVAFLFRGFPVAVNPLPMSGIGSSSVVNILVQSVLHRMSLITHMSY